MSATFLGGAGASKSAANDLGPPGSGTFSAEASEKEPTPALPKRQMEEQQRELLRQAAEGRRIMRLQQNLVGQHDPNTNIDLDLDLSRRAGYGDEVHVMREALLRGREAREQLVASNLGLVRHAVRSVTGAGGNHRDDFFQEGSIGLAKAVDKWDPEIGGKFSTYAYYWIKAAILRASAQRTSDALRIPEHAQTSANKLQKAAAALGLDLDAIVERRPADAQALADEAGLTPRQLDTALRVRERRNKGSVSFESWMQRGKDLPSDLTVGGAARAGLSPLLAATSPDLDDMKHSLAKFLRPKELEALSWRYGLQRDDTSPPRDDALDAVANSRRGNGNMSGPPVQGKWGEAMSFVEVGQRMQVSAEYGRRLCHTALDKLRRAAQDGSLVAPAALVY